MSVVFDPSGMHVRDVVFSSKAVTCPTWGGKNLDVLFTTTAQDKGVGEEGADEDGHVFRYEPPAGTRGQPKYEFGG
jgi:sugar lactone lactonase YvrE